MINETKLIEELNRQKHILTFEDTNPIDEGFNCGIDKAIQMVESQLKVSEWIPCSERLPKEHDSVFAELKGTDKWYPGMFEKMSDEVIVTCEYGDGTRVTKTTKTIDGEWLIETKSIFKLKVLFWQPLPEPYEVKDND